MCGGPVAPGSELVAFEDGASAASACESVRVVVDVAEILARYKEVCVDEPTKVWAGLATVVAHFARRGVGVIGVVPTDLWTQMPPELAQLLLDVVPTARERCSDMVLQVARRARCGFVTNRADNMEFLSHSRWLQFAFSSKGRFYTLDGDAGTSPTSSVDCAFPSSRACGMQGCYAQEASSRMFEASPQDGRNTHHAELPEGVHFVIFTYDGVEVSEVGLPEPGYLRVDAGDRVTVLVGSPSDGHARNRFERYVFGHRTDDTSQRGWLPTAALGICRAPGESPGSTFAHAAGEIAWDLERIRVCEASPTADSWQGGSEVCLQEDHYLSAGKVRCETGGDECIPLRLECPAVGVRRCDAPFLEEYRIGTDSEAMTAAPLHDLDWNEEGATEGHSEWRRSTKEASRLALNYRAPEMHEDDFYVPFLGVAERVDDLLRELSERLRDLGARVLKCVPWCPSVEFGERGKLARALGQDSAEGPSEAGAWSLVLLRLEGSRALLRDLRHGHAEVLLPREGQAPVRVRFERCQRGESRHRGDGGHRKSRRSTARRHHSVSNRTEAALDFLGCDGAREPRRSTLPAGPDFDSLYPMASARYLDQPRRTRSSVRTRRS